MSAPELQQQQTASGLSVQDMLRLEMLTSLEKYTKAMFKAQYKRSFIVAEHHRQIIDALQDVVDGKCRRLIINVAPRYGKCLDPSTMVLTPNGYKVLKRIKPGDKVMSWYLADSPRGRRFAIRENIVLATEHAYKESVTLELMNGVTITGSADHPLLWRDPETGKSVWREMGSFKQDETIPYYSFMSSAKRAEQGFYYTEDIRCVIPRGPRGLIHLEVERDHNFIANGLVSHNTELVIKSFISWCFALNPACRFLHLSYSDVLVEDNSATVRSIMQEPLYKALFPGSALLKDRDSSKRWKTKAGGEMYAVSTQGQVTGFGAGAVDLDPEIDRLDGGSDVFVFDDHTNEVLSMIGAQSNIFQGAVVIDDPIKPEDAESDLVRERINNRFETTIRNRVNSRNTPIIIIMQRLHEHDLCGYLQEVEPDDWRVLSLPVIRTDPETGEERALWPMKHSLEELHRMREINPIVFDTQYMQDPAPKEGLMYQGFRTYTQDELAAVLAASHPVRRNYTDTADTGSDSHCSICFVDTPETAYVTDVLFTDEPMETTEPAQARMLSENGTVDCLIESNNGGRGFARNVKRLLRTTFRNFRTVVHTFTQTKNKRSRIFSASAQVQNDIAFPVGWEKRWPKFYKAITSYRKDNKRSQHDDAPDCLTGVWEMHSGRSFHRKIRRMN